MKVVHRRAHDFLDVKERSAHSPSSVQASSRQANSPKADSIQRGLKLARIRCDFYNVFWPPGDLNFRSQNPSPGRFPIHICSVENSFVSGIEMAGRSVAVRRVVKPMFFGGVWSNRRMSLQKRVNVVLTPATRTDTIILVVISYP